MKNFLAVDTSSKYMTVLVRFQGKTFVRCEENCAMRHSVLLMPTIDAVLKEAGATIFDFDFFACVVGAGSFTGIRIGISAVKGFSLATGKPTLPVTSFEMAAYTAKEEKILVLSDALHGAFYASAYANGEIVLEPSYLAEKDAKEWRDKGFLPVALEKTVFCGEDVVTLSPAAALEKAVEKKARLNGFAELRALYIRKSQAEINLEKGELSV